MIERDSRVLPWHCSVQPRATHRLEEPQHAVSFSRPSLLAELAEGWKARRSGRPRLQRGICCALPTGSQAAFEAGDGRLSGGGFHSKTPGTMFLRSHSA
jgi:hypothetical protein